jgi:hypothetical protein
MPDWKKLVGDHTAALDLASAAQQDVINEVAAHLEDVYETARTQNLSEDDAIKFALQEAGDWNVLAANIQRAKSEDTPANHRTKSFWLPTLITLAGASLSLLLIQFIGMEPRVIWIDLRHVFPRSCPLYGKISMELYWPWLASLPFFGALGAYLSRRSQGNTSTRLLAGLSPAVIMLIVMCLILPFGLALDGASLFRLVVFGVWGLLNWVAIPVALLLLGALPCLRGAQPANT